MKWTINAGKAPAPPTPSAAADIHRAVALLAGLSPIAAATAELLEAIATDMDEAAAVERPAFAGTPAAHPRVWDANGPRLDWTAALALARTVLAAGTVTPR